MHRRRLDRSRTCSWERRRVIKNAPSASGRRSRCAGDDAWSAVRGRRKTTCPVGWHQRHGGSLPQPGSYGTAGVGDPGTGTTPALGWSGWQGHDRKLRRLPSPRRVANDATRTEAGRSTKARRRRMEMSGRRPWKQISMARKKQRRVRAMGCTPPPRALCRKQGTARRR